MAANFGSVLDPNSTLSSDAKTDVSDKQTLLAVLQFLRKNNLKSTEDLLKREAGIKDTDVIKQENEVQSESQVSHALAAYKSDDDPTLYDDHYTNLKTFVEGCLDVHKVELMMILYPVFVHMYLELVYNRHEQHAIVFFHKFMEDQEEYYQEDMKKLSTVTKPEHMKGNQLMDNFKSSKFVLKMSRDSYTHLKRYLQDKQLNILLNIIQEHLFIDVFDGIPRSKQQIDTSSGGMLGEASREANKTKIFYGLLKEPDLNVPVEEEDDGGGDGEDKPKDKLPHPLNLTCSRLKTMFVNNNIAFLGFLYFLQGLPYGLQSRFLPLYFRTHGMSLSDIGYFKILLAPWMLKALWAPLVDIYGTKRQWLSYSMAGLFITCLFGACTTPDLILQLGAVLFLFNVLTSTQDIAVDGLAIQILMTSELAAGNIAQVVGYKLGAVFSGGFLIWISETLQVSWSSLFLILSLGYLTAFVIVLKLVPASSKTLHKEKATEDVRNDRSGEILREKDEILREKDEIGREMDKILRESEPQMSSETSQQRFFQHFQQILSSSETRWILLYVLIYKLGEQGCLTMLPLFLVDNNIAAASVGFWTGIVGQSASILGSVLGGWLVSKYRYSPYQIIVFFSHLRMASLVVYPAYILLWSSQWEQLIYGLMIITVLIMLTGSGIITTTTTFTLMMYCPHRRPYKPKKKARRDPNLMKKSKNDPNSPAVTRIPLPELKDLDKLEKVNAYREALKRVKMGPNSLPSICFYTLSNAVQGVTSIDISEDSSLMSSGYGDSVIRISSLTPGKLKTMKTHDDLELIDKEADDVLERMMNPNTQEDCKQLLGHSGAVYSAEFSHDKNYLISSSEDGTVRLWSMNTWTNLVSYKGHNSAVWDVKFSPHGHYFVSGGHDRVARLWTTDHYQPVRIFAGHHSDVDCCVFHPNSNYVATGSSDRTVRIFDVLNGGCVRTLTGHKGAVHSLCFSPDGKYLASSGLDGIILLWDISNGNMVSQMKDHSDSVYSLCFSRCGSVLASGGLDNCVKLWDITKVMKEIDREMDSSIPSSLSVNDNPNLLIGSFHTKSTPVLSIHFTRKNLLLAAGPMKVS